MTDLPYDNGGLLPPPELIRIELHPDECVLEARRLRCARSDHNHRSCQREPDPMRGEPSGE